MPKKELFQKLTSYKEQLENILEKKDFSTDAENLLLNMLYKMENSYNDYEMVKRNVDDRKDLIEKILESVKECKSIEIIEANSAAMKKLKKQKIVYEVNKEEKLIKTFPEEKAILEALNSLNKDISVYIDEDYSAVRNSLPFVLMEGQKDSRTEIIRDFNAWSWNTDLVEFKNTEYNLVYNNITMLLGKTFMKELETKNANVIQILRVKLKEYFDTEEEITEFLELIFKISIIIYCKKDKKEKQRLEEELIVNLEELERLNNTEELINEITKSKQKNTKQIEKIDKILNSKDLIQKELEKIIDKEGQFITEEDLIQNLRRKRRKLEKGIKSSNKLLDAKYYSEYKQKIQNNVNILKAVKAQSKKSEYILKLQKYFIKGLKNRISSLTNKKDLMDMLYVVRYYNFIPYSEEKFIKDIIEIKAELNEIEELIISKMEQNKQINKFSNIAKFDRKLIKKIFKLRIINLEKINLEFQKGEKIRIIFYDDDTIEKGFEVKGNDIKILKYDKRIRIFS